MSTPARPELKFLSLDELLSDVEILRSGPIEQAGKWDLPMILDHLDKTMSSPSTAGIWNIPWPIGPIVRVFYHRLAKRETYPQVKFPAPKMLRPQAGISLEQAHEGFLQAIERLHALTGKTVNCPPFGTLGLEDFRKMQLLHGAHHLSFLKSNTDFV